MTFEVYLKILVCVGLTGVLLFVGFYALLVIVESVKEFNAELSFGYRVERLEKQNEDIEQELKGLHNNFEVLKGDLEDLECEVYE